MFGLKSNNSSTPKCVINELNLDNVIKNSKNKSV